MGTRIRFAAPETLRQAQRWQATKDRYSNEGLCDRCAAQASWAHQNRGDTWMSIHPPCPPCQPIVAGFPAATPSPQWRKIPQPEHPVCTTAPTAVAETEIELTAFGGTGVGELAMAGEK